MVEKITLAAGCHVAVSFATSWWCLSGPPVRRAAMCARADNERPRLLWMPCLSANKTWHFEAAAFVLPKASAIAPWLASFKISGLNEDTTTAKRIVAVFNCCSPNCL
jgi:hypothetical protein